MDSVPISQSYMRTDLEFDIRVCRGTFVAALYCTNCSNMEEQGKEFSDVEQHDAAVTPMCAAAACPPLQSGRIYHPVKHQWLEALSRAGQCRGIIKCE
ncbi:Hypothetical predicted protein [Pelobates cultripes]|uniref:Uncharacterized protein n=1 Tax=Pelobates cultripes TaxID=61616 RepID=A0AAD1RTA2_PELCU|nr:Hypothetical predicted protein [Pelobates cultripes]